jgi:signal transduction histidine kinase/CheY-like chemotaxis protein
MKAHDGLPSGANDDAQPAVPGDDEDLTASLAALSKLVMRESRLPVTLTDIAGFAVRAIPGADGAGLTLFRDDRPQTAVATAPFVTEADTLQYDIGEGPCITATGEGRTVRSDCLQRDKAFPRFGPQIAALGLNSMLSLPLLADGIVLGSINLYAHAENAFDERAEALGDLFAVPAAVAIQNAQALFEAQQLAAQLQVVVTRLAARSVDEVAGRLAAESVARIAEQQSGSAKSVKDQFLSRVSHELRTPLNAVLGFAQLLELEPLSASQHDSVEHIVRNGHRLLGMIEDVFDMTAIEAHQLDVALSPVRFADIVDDAIVEVLPLAKAAQVQLVNHTQPVNASVQVTADPGRVRQVVTNLLTNAIKFNHAGGRVDITLSTHRDEVAGTSSVHLIVVDTGVGIAADDLSRLFTPFDRLTHTSAIEGSGIGLALSQRLVGLMHGTLTVESVEGEGSTFTVAFPVADSPEDAAVPQAGKAHQPSGPRSDGSQAATASLLYIEDNFENVELIASIMRKIPSWRMAHTDLGAAGLEQARATVPDLILLDLHLPDLDGDIVLRELKSDPRTAGVPVVIVSADASHEQIRRMRTLGADDYFTKPLDVQMILDLLRDYQPAVS